MNNVATGVRGLRLPEAMIVFGAGLVIATGASAAVALLTGIGLAVTVGNPWPARTRALAHRTLAYSVMGLGAGMNLVTVAQVGAHGFVYTAIGIATALLLGTLLGRGLGVSRHASLLVTVGTAICGGSAIAAVAPVLRAKDDDVSVALVTVFLLNGVALFLFPAVGHLLAMDQGRFGLWCALAIHDTSSVVGAAAAYGERALEVATAAKLARALWIVPLTLVIAQVVKTDATGEGAGSPKRPWFIAGFVLIAAVVTFVPALRGAGHVVATLSHRLLALTLFLIGLGLSRGALRAVGVRSLAQAIALWIVMASGTLLAITHGWIG